jgi:hypothetical protein
MKLDPKVYELLHEGTVIPALPLALNADRKFDERRQRALVRYYMAAGAGGLAVAVHSTQFAIRDKDINLFEPVLRVAMEEMTSAEAPQPFIKIGGICGPTEQAVQEAELLADLGYDLGLLSMGGLDQYSEAEVLERAKTVAEVIPLVGFYLQPSVGGRVYSYDFWKEFVNIPAVKAIKIAPFNRYFSQDVVRAVCSSPRRDDIALYTGNDDNIVVDLLTPFRFNIDGKLVEKRIVGGLLGHWAAWTKKAVELLDRIKEVRDQDQIPAELLQLGVEITDCNAAFFDPFHDFAGVIPGIHEVLRRQGLLEGIWCLDPEETLSPGQLEEIDRVYKAYPHLNDDDFVKENLEKWLA